VIRLTNVSKSFDGGKSFALSDLNLDILEGETLVLLGSSGCGKTTTLRLINRLIDPTNGTIEVDNRNVLDRNPVELRRSIGYVFQGIGLFPHLTVRENVEIVPKLLGWSRSRRADRAMALLDMVSLHGDEYADRLPRELSGGQQQRVGFARALAADPDYLLMDEPFGALDTVTRDSLQEELLALVKRLKKTIVFVTHDVTEALRLGDRIAVLHEGRLEQVGPKREILGEPLTPFVRDLFLKPMEQFQLFHVDP